jgi:CheY-like chemotaxis protein
MLQDVSGFGARAVRRVRIPLPDCVTGDRKTILLVMADPNLRAAATRALDAAGYTVIPAAHSGHATLAALAGGRIDILAADLEMDDVPGPELAERLRRQHPGLQSLFFADTGRDSPSEPERLVRPFTREELLAALTALA